MHLQALKIAKERQENKSIEFKNCTKRSLFQLRQFSAFSSFIYLDHGERKTTANQEARKEKLPSKAFPNPNASESFQYHGKTKLCNRTLMVSLTLFQEEKERECEIKITKRISKGKRDK